MAKNYEEKNERCRFWILRDLPAELERFPPLKGAYTFIDAHPHINDLFGLDMDAACFMMLTRDLPSLFGIIV